MRDPYRYKHTIIVGGTGMLKGASHSLGTQSAALTSIARTERSLDVLRRALRHPNHKTYSLDYRDSQAFAAALLDAQRSLGEPDLGVGWFHGSDSPLVFAKNLISSKFRLFHVLGSAAADPATDPDRVRSPFRRFGNIEYHQVILGFVVEEDRSRWLTNSEISNGVLGAIESNATVSVVGTVRPWSARP